MLEYQYYGHHTIKLLRVPELATIGRIYGDIDDNMQGVESAIASSHVRTRDTRVAFSWPTAHSNTTVNHLKSYKTY